MTRKTMLLCILLAGCLLLAACGNNTSGAGRKPEPEITKSPYAEIFREKKKYGIRKDGKVIADAIWDYIEECPYSGGMLYMVSYKKKDGLMDENGELLIEPGYESVKIIRDYDYVVLEPKGEYNDPKAYQCLLYSLTEKKVVDTLPGKMLSSGGQSKGRFICWYGMPVNHEYPLGVYDVVTKKNLDVPVTCESMLNVSSELIGDYGLVLNYHVETGRSQYQYFSKLFTVSMKSITKPGDTFTHFLQPTAKPGDYSICTFICPDNGELLMVQTKPRADSYEYYKLPDLTRIGTEAYSSCTPFAAGDGSIRAIASSGRYMGGLYYGQVFLLNLTEGSATAIRGAVQGKDFSDGIAAVKDSSDRWACIDEQGRFVYDYLFEEPPVFSNGQATTIYKYKKVTIDKNGNIK